MVHFTLALFETDTLDTTVICPTLVIILIFSRRERLQPLWLKNFRSKACHIKDYGIHEYPWINKRLNTGMAPTCDRMIKIVKVHKLYLNSLHVSIVNRVYRSGTMKYRCENTDVSNKKWLLT